MSTLYVLGLPSREFVRNRIVDHVSPIDMRRIHWIRVAHQLAGIGPRGTLYMLADSRAELGMAEHAELRSMLAARRWELVDVTAESLAQIMDNTPRAT